MEIYRIKETGELALLIAQGTAISRVQILSGEIITIANTDLEFVDNMEDEC